MSRRLNSAPFALLQLPIMFLLSLGVALPLLHGAGMIHLAPQYALISAAVTLCAGVLMLRKRLLPASLLVLTLSQAILYFFDTGFFKNTLDCFRILQLYFKDADTALYLYGDILCTQLAVYLTLLCCLISLPDNGLYLPLICTAAFLTGEWMIGLHDSSLYMLPVLPAIALHYAATHRMESTDHEHSLRAVSPLALPLCAMLMTLSFLLAPADGTTIEPFASYAQKIRDTIDDHFFFTEERSRYTLASDGWMPLGQTQLGGPANPSERSVMRVVTDETAYLRGAILDTYTGGMWYDSISARRYGWNAAHYRAIRNELYQTTYPLVSAQAEKELSVTILGENASTLFTPQRIRVLTLGDNMVGYFNTGTEIFITRNLRQGDQYAVRYLPMKATDSGMLSLVNANAQVDDPAMEQMKSLYTHLPSHLQQEIFEIADLATENAITPWEKAVAIRDYLKTNYAYSLDVKAPPESVDFVAWFLLAEQKGYCTYFATAMTVLCRIAGLPARYVEGYIAKPDANGEALVTGLDAHAWTEIYLNGVGWVTFDATASVNEPDRSGESAQTPDEYPTPSPEPEFLNTPTPEPEASMQDTPTPAPDSPPESTSTPEPESPPDKEPPQTPPDNSLPWLWLLLLIALILCIALRIRRTHPLYRAQKARNDTLALLILWDAILACAARLGYKRSVSETPLQFALRSENGLGTRMADIAEAVSAVRYGRHAAPEESLPRARSVYQALEERLSLWHKFALSIIRALTWR